MLPIALHAELLEHCSFLLQQTVLMSILFVNGVNDLSTVGVTLDDSGKPQYLINGNCSIHHRLPLRAGIVQSFLLFGKGVRQPAVRFEPLPSLIFNQISDADTHRGALERCIELCQQVNTTVINHPRHVLNTSRDGIASLLQGIPGVIVPRTQRFRPRSPDEVFSRAAAERFAFPFIIRTAGTHDGANMIRVDSRADYPSLHALPFDGRDFYLIEYFDYRDGQGLHHKQRIVVIDGDPLVRHSLFNDDWNVHGSSRKFMIERESWDDEQARVDHFAGEVQTRLRPTIDEITRRIKLEYYGIDCNIRPDGSMIVFEANASMNVLNNDYPIIQYRIDAIGDHIRQMLTRYSGERVS